MQAYIFQVTLLCDSCGVATCDQLRATTKELHPDFDESNESTFDSDYFPKGPYPNGGGEADTPQHCDHCGVFLENPLTDQGARYVRERAAPYISPDDEGEDWAIVADRADEDGRSPLATWIRFYFAPGQ